MGEIGSTARFTSVHEIQGTDADIISFKGDETTFVNFPNGASIMQSGVRGRARPYPHNILHIEAGADRGADHRADVFSALKRQHPELNIQHDIYPKYRTVGELQVCTAAFIRWMDRRVDAMRAELGFGREQVCDEDMGGGAPAVSEYSVAGDKELAVFLIGHS